MISSLVDPSNSFFIPSCLTIVRGENQRQYLNINTKGLKNIKLCVSVCIIIKLYECHEEFNFTPQYSTMVRNAQRVFTDVRLNGNEHT